MIIFHRFFDYHLQSFSVSVTRNCVMIALHISNRVGLLCANPASQQAACYKMTTKRVGNCNPFPAVTTPSNIGTRTDGLLRFDRTVCPTCVQFWSSNLMCVVVVVVVYLVTRIWTSWWFAAGRGCLLDFGTNRVTETWAGNQTEWVSINNSASDSETLQAKSDDQSIEGVTTGWWTGRCLLIRLQASSQQNRVGVYWKWNWRRGMNGWMIGQA